ncbi:MAG: hypothetical protein WC374_11715 [Phycisphaerae bacterium]
MDEETKDVHREKAETKHKTKPAGFLIHINAAVIIILALYFFVIPFFMMIYFLSDPALKTSQPGRFAYWLHRCLSPKYQHWAYDRVSTGKAESMHIEDISGTEWPMFGSVFYLLGTEYLEQGLKDSNNNSAVPPSNYAAGAIEAATDLIVDERHAAWVKMHWGEDYRHRENIFYRMLLISGTTSYENLLGGGKHIELLRDQVETLSTELNESRFGLLDDYPGQCFPTDVIAALAAIKRADQVLGTDHNDFLDRSLRGFERNLVDPVTLMPPYMADKTCACPGDSRGCSGQWGVRWAAYLWPETAKNWYESFDKHFWQRRFGFAGFREFREAKDQKNWYFDVDSGPVVGGFGAAASAFGLGAARANGRFDHAYPLAVEAIVISWPLPDGTLLLPRFLSNMSDAPYLGECAILFNIAQPTAPAFQPAGTSDIPGIVYIALLLYILMPLILIISSIQKLKRWRKYRDRAKVPVVKSQAAAWIVFFAVGLVCIFFGLLFHGLIFILLCQLLPLGIKFPKQQVVPKQPQDEK